MIYDQITSNIRRSRLLLGLIVLLIAALGWALFALYGDPLPAVLAVAAVAALSVAGYYNSDKIVLAASHARPVEASEYPHYVNSVEGLAIAAGIPQPRSFVIDDPAPNAFATGRDPERAVVCVTTGLLEMMNRAEMEGVIAHEVSHIKNYDIRFMTVVAVLAGAVALMADFFWRGSRFGIFGRSRRGWGRSQVVVLVVGLVLLILAPVSAALVQAAISRRREYLADADGALLTRYPEGLAGALEKIASDPNKLAVANKATAHLFIANPLRDYGGPFNRLFDTHPPIEDRIRRLREM